MFPRHRQRGDVHGEAAIHVESPDEEETATTNDGSEEKDVSLIKCEIKKFFPPHLCHQTGFTVQLSDFICIKYN